MADGGAFEELRDWGSKAAGAVSRIAAGFEIVMDPYAAGKGSVSAENIERAGRIVEALAPHAIAALNMMACDSQTAKAIRILGWVRRNGAPTFSLRDVHQNFRTPKPDDLREPLDILESRGYLRARPAPERAPGRRGRAPSPEWDIHPSLVRSGRPSPHNSQNPQKTDSGSDSVNYVNSVTGGDPDTGADEATTEDDSPGRRAATQSIEVRAQALHDAAVAMEIDGGPCPPGCPVHRAGAAA